MGRSHLWGGVIAACVAWATMFCFYGAYRTHTEAVRLTSLAGHSASALAGALSGAGVMERAAALRAATDPSRGGLIRAAALVGSDGTLVASSPEMEPVAAPAAAGGCSVCHQRATTVPAVGPVALDGLVYVFQPRAVAGNHLYLAFDAELLSHGAHDLPVIFFTGLAAVAALFAAVWLVGHLLGLVGAGESAQRSGVRHLPETEDGPDGLVAAITRHSGPAQEVGPRLSRRLTRWVSSGDTCLSQLERLKRGSLTIREIGQRILDSTCQFRALVEEFGKHLNGISTSTSDNSSSLIELTASVDEVAASAEKLSEYVLSTAGSVEQMVRAIGEVADRVETLAEETDTTAASMARIDASTRDIEVNARQATALSGRMAEAARDGSHAVDKTLRGIHFSYGVIQETARAMDELQEASRAITGVVKIINEINDKTKLLALNAAIIAAQAGEHGKSFGVVAHEIKNLSDRTASSTGEISRLIKGIHGRMSVAAEAVARGEEATGSSVELAERAGEALRHILDTAQVSHDMIREILLATEEQSRGSQKVTASMQEVNSMVNYIRQAALEHRSSGEAVEAQTSSMRELTEQVKLATAEQAEVSRYISDAIAATDGNLQIMVNAVHGRRSEAELIVSQAEELRQRSEAGASAAQAAEESLGLVIAELNALRRALAGNGGGGETESEP